MAIYKLPLDDELDVDIIDWIASFPRNKKSEVVRHALRYYMNASKGQEQAFIVNPVVPVVPAVEVHTPTVVEQPKPVEQTPIFGGMPPRKGGRKKPKTHGLLGDDLENKDGVPNVSMEDLR